MDSIESWGIFEGEHVLQDFLIRPASLSEGCTYLGWKQAS